MNPALPLPAYQLLNIIDEVSEFRITIMLMIISNIASFNFSKQANGSYKILGPYISTERDVGG